MQLKDCGTAPGHLFNIICPMYCLPDVKYIVLYCEASLPGAVQSIELH